MSAPPVEATPRLRKGQKTREDILEAAVRLASVRGMEGLSIGMLATETGMSKAGLLAHFGNKETLQLAAIDAARDLVRRRVLEPAMSAPEGLPQIQDFIRRYLDYIEQRVLPGGCFFTAISVEFDDQDGPVRERIVQYQGQRDEIVIGLLRRARKLGHLREDIDEAQLAFELLTFMQGAVVRYQILREAGVLERTRQALGAMLARATA